MIDIDKAIASAVKTGKVSFGANAALLNAKTGKAKMIVLASNCPKKVKDDWGDRVQLPLRINLNTSRRSNFIRDLASFDPENYADEPDWAVLDQVVPIDSEWVQRMIERFGLER